MQTKQWTVTEAYEELQKRREQLGALKEQKEKVTTKLVCAYEEDKKDAYRVACEELDQLDCQIRKFVLMIEAAKKILSTTICNSASKMWDKALVKFAGKRIGDKTRAKLYAFMLQEIQKEAPFVTFVSFSSYHYGLDVNIGYDKYTFWWEGNHKLLCDNRLNPYCHIKQDGTQYPCDLEEWAEEWVTKRDEIMIKIKCLNDEISEIATTLNIGEARLPDVEVNNYGY